MSSYFKDAIALINPQLNLEMDQAIETCMPNEMNLLEMIADYVEEDICKPTTCIIKDIEQCPTHE